MLVQERMTHPVITLHPKMSVHDALALFKKERIRRAPVVESGKLIGIVSDKDLLNASPSPATSLSVWEVNYLVSKLTVDEVMTRNVITVSEDTPVEEAARIMADNKIGGLPVMRDGQVIGIITETDLFKVLLELMGAREPGVRVTVVVKDEHGKLAELTTALSQAGANFVALSQAVGKEAGTRLITLKMTDISPEAARNVLAPLTLKIMDFRSC